MLKNALYGQDVLLKFALAFEDPCCEFSFEKQRELLQPAGFKSSIRYFWAVWLASL